MKYVIPFLFLSLLGGCTCDCDEEGNGTIPVSFNTDTASGGFSENEIDHIMLIQTGHGKTDSLALRTVAYPDTARKELFFFIYNSISTPEFFNPNTYHFVNASVNLDIILSDIRTKNVAKGNPGCTCYRNEDVTFNLNGTPVHRNQISVVSINKP